MSTFFDDLLESVQQMDEILRGKRQPSRELHIDALQEHAKENRDRSNVFVDGNSRCTRPPKSAPQ